MATFQPQPSLPAVSLAPNPPALQDFQHRPIIRRRVPRGPVHRKKKIKAGSLARHPLHQRKASSARQTQIATRFDPYLADPPTPPQDRL